MNSRLDGERKKQGEKKTSCATIKCVEKRKCENICAIQFDEIASARNFFFTANESEREKEREKKSERLRSN